MCWDDVMLSFYAHTKCSKFCPSKPSSATPVTNNLFSNSQGNFSRCLCIYIHIEFLIMFVALCHRSIDISFKIPCKKCRKLSRSKKFYFRATPNLRTNGYINVREYIIFQIRGKEKGGRIEFRH